MKAVTKSLALITAVLAAIPSAYTANASVSESGKAREAQQTQVQNDWNTASRSLQDAYENFPARARAAKADLDDFLNDCGKAFSTIQQGFVKAGPDFGKAMNSLEDSIKKAGKAFDNPGGKKKHRKESS